MNSVVLYTEEIDDIELAAEELLSQASGFEFRENSLGILFMDAEAEYEELYGLLREEWSFPIVGATAIGTLTGREGYCRSGISVMLMTADDCRFYVGMTEGLSVDNYREPIRQVYEGLEQDAGGEEIKLVLTFGGKAKGMSGDDIINALDELGKKVKVYGALASDMFTFSNYRAIYNDRIEFGEQVFVLITGNVNPKFLSIKSLSGKANFSYEVTKSEGNVVYRLGTGTFLEALEKSGLSTDKDLVVAEYIQTPFITSYEKPGGIHVEASRNLTQLNRQNGSGLFLGGISEGSSLEIGILNRDDVRSTVKKAFDEIIEWLKTEGTYCKTILCCSCAARFLALGNNGMMEAESYQGRLPEGVSLMGIYSYGEFCPVCDDEWSNVFHNSTFTILCI
ncbi:MAG: FIST C-terminal domain-containing protein [Eubacterium sp.]|nr:FIST C-terminal domain-containing protein [Eubacterium sp.]